MDREIHRLVRAQLAANASHVRVRLERARARERMMPMEPHNARLRVAKEIRELSAQLEAWVTIMALALARMPKELRESDEADRCGVQFMGGGACVLPVGHWENEGTTHKLRDGDKS